jgi:hypothetical protein
LIFRINDRPGVREESHHYAFTASSFSKFTQAFDDLLMAVMHPIESTDGRYGVIQFPKIRNVVIYFHNSRIKLKHAS